MKKSFKRISALLTAGVLTIGMSVCAISAAAASLTRDAGTQSSETALTIKKEIAFFNPTDNTEINYPAITYTYTVAPVTVSAGVTVKDSEGTIATVKSGITDGVTMDTDNKAEFAAGSVAASPNGTIKEDTFKVNIDVSKFSAAGIYRYEITETPDTQLNTLGYTAAGKAYAKRYLDVYIISGDNNALSVSGYVLFYSDENTSSLSFNGKDNEVMNTGNKTEGFVHEASSTGDSGSTIDYSSDDYIDKYKTYNVTINKTITGNMADKTHEFPFYASITGAPSASTVTIKGTVSGSNATDRNDLTLSSSNAAATNIADLSNDGSVTLKGIPVGSTVQIYEQNNTAEANYKITTEGAEIDLNNSSFDNDNKSGTVSVKSDDLTDKAVTFTNSLGVPSPTGLIMRFAPYLAIIGIGALLFIISFKRKKD